MPFFHKVGKITFGKYMHLRVYLVIYFCIQGTVINEKHELHKRAEDNRAYAHYRWW